MTDGEALLRAIIDEPDDDTHRLVYADWLDENGRPGHAAYIRAQIVGGTSSAASLMSVWPRLNETLAAGADLPPDWLGWVFLWRRGFVEAVECPFAEWYRHGKAICAAHPVVGLKFSDYQPYLYGSDQNPCWVVYVNREESLMKYPGHQRYLPKSFAPHMGGEGRRDQWGHVERLYHTSHEAVTAVCEAALSWAKERT